MFIKPRPSSSIKCDGHRLTKAALSVCVSSNDSFCIKHLLFTFSAPRGALASYWVSEFRPVLKNCFSRNRRKIEEGAQYRGRWGQMIRGKGDDYEHRVEAAAKKSHLAPEASFQELTARVFFSFWQSSLFEISERAVARHMNRTTRYLVKNKWWQKSIQSKRRLRIHRHNWTSTFFFMKSRSFMNWVLLNSEDKLNRCIIFKTDRKGWHQS